MNDVMRELERVATESGAARIERIRVRLGPLSHFTPGHFREHFEDAARGTLAEGAAVEAFVDETLDGERAQGVVLASVEVDVPDRMEVG
jgi:hydrogenase nickel incorporation protein HypA/HybF